MPLPLIPLDLPPTIEIAETAPAVTATNGLDPSLAGPLSEQESWPLPSPRLPQATVSRLIHPPGQRLDWPGLTAEPGQLAPGSTSNVSFTAADLLPPEGSPTSTLTLDGMPLPLAADDVGAAWVDGGIPSARLAQGNDSEAAPPEPAAPEPAAPDPTIPESTTPDPTTPEEPATPARALRLEADRQVFDPNRQVVTATGDVLVQFGNSQLAANRLWVNLNNRHLRAEGDVFFNRNEQIIEGETATYNLLQGAGEITFGRGELLLPALGEDLSATFANDQPLDSGPVDYRLQGRGSISQVTSPGGVSLTTDPQQTLFGGESGDLRRIRFESETIYFDADGWYADNVRLTNDPFSPPELELRGDHVRLTPLNEVEDELIIENPRLVFDQGLSIPLLRNRFILQRGQFPADALNPVPPVIGIDGRDRDGVFVERDFRIPLGGPLQLTVTPQFFIARWLGSSDANLFDPANFGLVAEINGALGPRTTATGVLNVSGLDLDNFPNRLRASFRTQRLVGTHRLNLEYSYRDRLFNGSLGFQDVQSSLGVLLESPIIPLGNTAINLSYQVSGQYVTANTDRTDLLNPGETLELTNLFRFQGSVDLSRGFLLWQGQARPSTPTEGLRYSPRPLVPSLVLIAGLRGTATYYTSSDIQESLEARIAIGGQFGHLERNYLDYTQFNIGFSSTFIAGDPSPFLFDRVADQNVLTGGIIQQIYGPVLAGFQTAINVDTGQEIDTNFVLEYRRRAYGVLVRYNPIQDTGFIGFRISDFNWTGRTDPFDQPAPGNDVMVQ